MRTRDRERLLSRLDLNKYSPAKHIMPLLVSGGSFPSLTLQQLMKGYSHQPPEDIGRLKTLHPEWSDEEALSFLFVPVLGLLQEKKYVKYHEDTGKYRLVYRGQQKFAPGGVYKPEAVTDVFYGGFTAEIQDVDYGRGPDSPNYRDQKGNKTTVSTSFYHTDPEAMKNFARITDAMVKGEIPNRAQMVLVALLRLSDDIEGGKYKWNPEGAYESSQGLHGRGYQRERGEHGRFLGGDIKRLGEE